MMNDDMTARVIALPGGEWFATLARTDSYRGSWNAPGGTPGQAMLNAWSALTAHRADVAWLQAAIRKAADQ